MTAVSQLLPPRRRFNLGRAWAATTINTVAFRHHGLLSRNGWQFGAFYRDSRTLCLFRRNLVAGTVETFILSGTYTLADAHNSISLGFDRNDCLHLCYDLHGNAMHYRRARSPLAIDDWTEELPMTGRYERGVTYPTFLVSPRPGPLLMLYRLGTHNRGESRLKRYDETRHAWEDLDGPLMSGADHVPWTSNAYWNHPAIEPDGRLHLSFVWRTDPVGAEARVNNVNVCYAVSADHGISWQTSRGLPLQLPITQVNAETVLAVAPGSNLMNQCGMAVDARGLPHVVFYADDRQGIPQYQHLWFDGQGWHHTVVTQRVAPFALSGAGTLDLPISRPDLVIDRQNRVYLIYRGDLTADRLVCQRLLPPDYLPNPADVRVLCNAELGRMEPVLDRGLWNEQQILSLLVQRNLQPPGDCMTVPFFEPISLCDWDLAWD